MQQHFETLNAWKSGRKLVKEIYQATTHFPKEEQYGLTGQLRRASVSIPANIAEGKGRQHKKEYLQFLYQAQGSAYEVITLLQLSEDLSYLTNTQAQALLRHSGEVVALLTGLIRSLQ